MISVVNRPLRTEIRSVHFRNTSIGLYEGYEIPCEAERIARELQVNKDLVVNFASLDNVGYNQITESLQKWKMVVDWLEGWRNSGSYN